MKKKTLWARAYDDSLDVHINIISSSYDRMKSTILYDVCQQIHTLGLSRYGSTPEAEENVLLIEYCNNLCVTIIHTILIQHISYIWHFSMFLTFYAKSYGNYNK